MNYDLHRYLFKDRFEKNLKNKDMYYLYNIELSKSFYFLLQNLELTLRNKIDEEISKEYPNWLNNYKLLEENEIKKIETLKKKYDINLISKLDFGFYSRLFDSKYEKKIWHKIIKKVFPNLNKTNRNRRYLSDKLHKFKSLRNKIAHHEPIYFWDNLESYHNDIINFIGYMSLDIKKFTILNDTFKNIIKKKEII